jgi:hypothetical protein
MIPVLCRPVILIAVVGLVDGVLGLIPGGVDIGERLTQLPVSIASSLSNSLLSLVQT